MTSDLNPEKSENLNDYNGIGSEGGQWIAMDARDIKNELGELGVTETGLIKWAAVLLNHGIGHISGVNHWKRGQDITPQDYYNDKSISFSYIMGEGYNLAYAINKYGYEAVTSNDVNSKKTIATVGTNGKRTAANVTNNQDYQTAVRKRLGDDEAKPTLIK
ncbi:MAG: hypothetical protein V9F05_06250 [Chitinophagaceae bacterium]